MVVTSHINLGTSLTAFDLTISLSAQLIDKTNFAAFCIKNAIKSDMSCKQIIQTVKYMITDNEAGMLSLLGEVLLNKIKTFEL